MKSSFIVSWWLMVVCLPIASTLVQPQFNKAKLKDKVLEMFRHGYWSYMQYAYPADELMPLTCQGRVRGVTASRGDVDDCLGQFSLTLIDTLDSLVVLGEFDEFERATKLIINDVRFDNDVVVSVFETNIRVVGGLISGHLMANLLKGREDGRMQWYTNELLLMAVDVADRLLPAFNTTTGMPHPRVNLKRGLTEVLKNQHDTCTACSGTLILEFAALSRLSGDPKYEQLARKGMDFLWQQRHRTSDLMGTVLNVHSGDWIRRDSGIGAGIDSYYEYCLKAFILLGDESFLHRFNKHYDAVMKFVSKGPLFVDVHMHRPTVASRPFMDSLLAFWPGLQVLKGDLKPAIETHEMLYQVIKKHKFLPEAFTHDFQVHWGQYPLRPEFVESTYFLYRATKDPHYLEVAETIIDSMNTHLRVPCGFAGVKDVRTLHHEDRMDSFVLAETFKYLYMIFAEADDLIFDPDSFVFTTEAHMLPLSIGQRPNHYTVPSSMKTSADKSFERSEAAPAPSPEVKRKWKGQFARSCPNSRQQMNVELSAYARHLRHGLKDLVENTSRQYSRQQQQQCSAQATDSANVQPSISAREFDSSNAEHVRELRRMGIEISDGGSSGMLHLTHTQHSVSRDGDSIVHEDTRVRDWLSSAHIPASVLAARDDHLDMPLSTRDGKTSARILSFSQWLIGELNAGDVVALTAVIFGVWFATMLTVTVTAVVCACVIKCVHQYVKCTRDEVPVLEEAEEQEKSEEEKESGEVVEEKVKCEEKARDGERDEDKHKREKGSGKEEMDRIEKENHTSKDGS